MSASELKIIAPRRNFLIRALGFTAAGAVLPISIITADDAKARIAHHQAGLEKAWRDYYVGCDVRMHSSLQPQEVHDRAEISAKSVFMICAGG
jgi:hypothetical protein